MRKLSLFLILIALPLFVVAACNTTAKKTDNQITDEVKSKIKADSQLASADIHVSTDDGVVKLHGKVITQEEAERALQLARSVPEVKNVNSELKVDTEVTNADVENRVEEGEEAAKEQREKVEGDRASIIDDATITTRVKMKLAEDKTVSALHIDVDTKNQVVTLTGTVKSDAEARRVIQIAQSVEDVKDVNSVLTVNPKG